MRHQWVLVLVDQGWCRWCCACVQDDACMDRHAPWNLGFKKLSPGDTYGILQATLSSRPTLGTWDATTQWRLVSYVCMHALRCNGGLLLAACHALRLMQLHLAWLEAPGKATGAHLGHILGGGLHCSRRPKAKRAAIPAETVSSKCNDCTHCLWCRRALSKTRE